jgi:glycosyltransferase involved in cell wall biosynthesis
MMPDTSPPRLRSKMLFLSFTYPSAEGSGSQLRAASLIRMLSTDSDIHLLIAGYTESVSGPPDPALNGLCKKIVNLRVLPSPETGGSWSPSLGSAKIVVLPTIDCAPGDAAQAIIEFYKENNLESLFVFRFDALHFVCDRLDFFPVRYLDLDELPSRSQAQIARLRQDLQPGSVNASERIARATGLIMEKAFIPRFHRVFVSSAIEAEAVRLRTGFPQPWVLPNIFPALPIQPEKRTSAKFEILFVGSFFYYPNVDAVLYFCREILPLIQEKRGETVLFRIIGMGSARELQCVREQPGVHLAGYQEDLAPFYHDAAVVVVPLRAGVGTRLKILEAFAYGRPVVSTSIGAEGLEVTDRKNILLADTPGTFAKACIDLMDQPALAEEICQAANRLHRDLYSEDALLRCYENIPAAEFPPLS